LIQIAIPKLFTHNLILQSITRLSILKKAISQKSLSPAQSEAKIYLRQAPSLGLGRVVVEFFLIPCNLPLGPLTAALLTPALCRSFLKIWHEFGVTTENKADTNLKK
jgi:hypothetical protein